MALPIVIQTSWMVTCKGYFSHFELRTCLSHLTSPGGGWVNPHFCPHFRTFPETRQASSTNIWSCASFPRHLKLWRHPCLQMLGSLHFTFYSCEVDGFCVSNTQNSVQVSNCQKWSRLPQPPRMLKAPKYFCHYWWIKQSYPIKIVKVFLGDTHESIKAKVNSKLLSQNG